MTRSAPPILVVASTKEHLALLMIVADSYDVMDPTVWLRDGAAHPSAPGRANVHDRATAWIGTAADRSDPAVAARLERLRSLALPLLVIELPPAGPDWQDLVRLVRFAGHGR